MLNFHTFFISFNKHVIHHKSVLDILLWWLTCALFESSVSISQELFVAQRWGNKCVLVLAWNQVVSNNSGARSYHKNTWIHSMKTYRSFLMWLQWDYSEFTFVFTLINHLCIPCSVVFKVTRHPIHSQVIVIGEIDYSWTAFVIKGKCMIVFIM